MHFRSRAFLVASAAIAVALTASLLGQSTPLTVLSKEGRRSLATTLINGQEFVALDDVAAMFQLAVREDALGAITASYKGKTIVLTPDQAIASISGRLVSLPAGPVRASGAGRRWLVPPEFISRALALVYDQRLELRRASRLLVVGDARVPRVLLRYEPAGPGGHLTIDATPRASIAVTRDGDHLTVRFDADGLDVANVGSQFPVPGVIQSFRVTEPSALTFDLGARFGAFKTTTQSVDASARLIIDITIAQAPTPEVPAPAPALPTPALPAPPALPPPAPDLASLLPGANATSIRTVAIDPGHGGDESGAKGAAGAIEKDITLAVARKVKAAVESRMGIRVLLTRDDDRSVSIDDRTAVANNGKADLLISLHANASLRPAMAGASIATAVFERQADQIARALTPERLSAAGGGSREIEFIPWDVAQIPHLEQSRALAAIIERQFKGRIPLAARAVESAPLRILESANMPAVLVEMGYLTNADQEKKLASDAFQNALVQALFDAIVKFRDRLDDERRETAAKGGR